MTPEQIQQLRQKQYNATASGLKVANSELLINPVKPGDTVVFLATGTGEAPHNYMIWELLRRGHAGKIVSVCCVRFLRDLGYLDIQRELMRRHGHYKYITLTTRENLQAGQKVYI